MTIYSHKHKRSDTTCVGRAGWQSGQAGEFPLLYLGADRESTFQAA